MTVHTDPAARSVILVGPPGAGKSTIGRKLARELGVSLYDTDAGIEEDTGRSIPEIFATDGEPEFRRIEERVVRRAVLDEHGVVSLGGGAVLSEATRELLRGRTVIYLEISVAEGLRRTGASTNRPLLNGDDPGAKYRELMRIRRPLYREVASIRIRTDGRSPGRVVRAVLTKLGIEPTEPPAPQTNPQQSGKSTSRRARSRSRRRRARPAPETPQQPDGTGETSGANTSRPDDTAARPDPAGPEANSPQTGQPRRRARRSRRGGRRHSRTRPASGAESATEAAAAGATTTPAGRQHAESDPNTRPARGRRSATRAAGPPAPNTTAAADSSTATGARAPARRLAENPPATVSSATVSAAEPISGPDDPAPPVLSGERDEHESAPGAGRSRRARARRARLRRALQESEQHT